MGDSFADSVYAGVKCLLDRVNESKQVDGNMYRLCVNGSIPMGVDT